MLKTSAIAILFASCGFAAHLAGQAPAKPPTVAELQARIAVLEGQLADVQMDYRLLLAACQPLPGADVAAPGSASQDPQAPEPDVPWFVKDTNYTVTEDNDLYTRFAWTLTVNNGASSVPRAFDITAEFVDEQGLVVATGRLIRTTVEEFGEKTFAGDTRIDKPTALRVRDARLIATPR